MSLFRNPPKTQYVETGAGFVGYQVFGEGPNNIVYSGSTESNAEAIWDIPEAVGYLEKLGSFGRVLFFDSRGSGISDPGPGNGTTTMESFNDDTQYAMEAAGFERATIIGDVEGGPRAMLFAATYPDKVDGLILTNTFARFLRDTDYPIGIPPHAMSNFVTWLRSSWGTTEYFARSSPSVLDLETRKHLARYQRMSTTPSVVNSVVEFYSTVDVRWLLPAITAPTLILSRAEARFHRPTFGRFLADHIAGAKFVELPGADTAPFFTGDTAPALSAIGEFITGERIQQVPNRTLATVMFTDIVGSTRQAAELGDARWIEILERHRQLTRQYISRYRGTEVNTTGDGFLATFDGPTRAVTCAADLVAAVQGTGVELRAGLHTGEIEEDGSGDIGGLAVHIASRVADAFKEPGVVVSSTVKDLVTGSGILFDSIGEVELKGIPGSWSLHRVLSVP